MNTISKARGTFANIIGVIFFAVVLAILAAVAGYLSFLGLFGVLLVFVREGMIGRRVSTVFGTVFSVGSLLAVMTLVLVGGLWLAHLVGGWWLAGPMVAVAVFIIQATLRAQVVRS